MQSSWICNSLDTHRSSTVRRHRVVSLILDEKCTLFVWAFTRALFLLSQHTSSHRAKHIWCWMIHLFLLFVCVAWTVFNIISCAHVLSVHCLNHAFYLSVRAQKLTHWRSHCLDSLEHNEWLLKVAPAFWFDFGWMGLGVLGGCKNRGASWSHRFVSSLSVLSGSPCVSVAKHCLEFRLSIRVIEIELVFKQKSLRKSFHRNYAKLVHNATALCTKNQCHRITIWVELSYVGECFQCGC